MKKFSIIIVMVMLILNFSSCSENTDSMPIDTDEINGKPIFNRYSAYLNCKGMTFSDTSSSRAAENLDDIYELTVSYCDNIDLTWIAALPSLRSLTIENTDLSNIDLFPLYEKDIDEIKIHGCRNINLNALPPNVKALEIYGTPKIILRDLIQYTNLESLSVEYRYITDHEAFNSLENLSELGIISTHTPTFAAFYNTFDMSYITNLSKLKSLSLIDVEITNFEEICAVNNIEEFHCNKPQYITYEGLAALTKLKVLDLSERYVYRYRIIDDHFNHIKLGRNSIPDCLTAIKEMPYLEVIKCQSDLDLSMINDPDNIRELLFYSEAVDLNDFKAFVNLQHLSFCANSVCSSIELPQLKSLECNGFTNDYSFLKMLPELEELSIETHYGINIDEMDMLKNISYCTKLRRLSANGFSVLDKNIDEQDFSFIGILSELEELELSGFGISDITFLENMPMLEKLDLSRNNISDISAIGKLDKLTELDLYDNKIKNADALSGIIKLEALNLKYNELTNIRFVENKIFLRELDLSYNKFKDPQPLSGLICLEELCVNGCRFIDLDFLYSLPSLCAGDFTFSEDVNIEQDEFLRLREKYCENDFKGIVSIGTDYN